VIGAEDTSPRCRRSEGIGRGFCTDELTVDLYWDDDVEKWALQVRREGTTTIVNYFWTYEEGLSAYEEC